MNAKLTDNQHAVLANYAFGDGRWFDSVAGDLNTLGIIKDKKTAKVVLNQLIKKSLLHVDTTVEEGSSWVTLSDQGKEVAAELQSPAEEEDDLIGTQDVIEGTPEDEVADALAEIEAEEAQTTTVEAPHDGIGEVTVVTADNYTERSWTDGDGVEWTETVFVDGSRTVKRRKQVSGSWRTDYWGAEFEGDKETYTTAKFAKMARAYGTFTHNPII